MSTRPGRAAGPAQERVSPHVETRLATAVLAGRAGPGVLAGRGPVFSAWSSAVRQRVVFNGDGLGGGLLHFLLRVQ
jgi:hypothetical protein